jgi:hypothetical protein
MYGGQVFGRLVFKKKYFLILSSYELKYFT